MQLRTVFTTTLVLLAVFFFCYGDTVTGVIVLPAFENDSRVDDEPHRFASSDENVRKAGGVIGYTAVGDSITVGVGASTPANSYVERLAQFVESDTGMTVNVDNRGVNGMTSAQLLTALQNDAAMRTSLQSAQIITVNIGSNDFAAARSSYRNLTCGVIDGEDCLRAAIAQFKSNWSLIVAEIVALRANSGVSVRAFDLYYPTVQTDVNSDSFPGDGGLNDFQALRPYLDEANMHIRSVSLSNGLAVGRVHRSFNGIDGGSDPGSNYGLIAADGFHPNDRGHSVIADRLHATSPICLPPPLKGPRAFYRAEGNANDTTANNNHGTLENGTSFTAGQIGQAFGFDGVDDSILLPQVNLGLNYTIELWIKPAPTQFASFVHVAANDQFATNAFGALGLFTDTPGTPGNYSLRYAESSALISTPQVIQPGRWTHVAMTRSSGVARLYVDGILLATGGTLGGYNNQLRFGHSIGASTTFYAGAIDEVSLFDRTLSFAEIAGIVDADSAGRCGATTDLQISPASVTVNAGFPQTFTATGGASPYVFLVASNPPQHGSIDVFSGVYTGATAGVDTVQVVDASMFTSSATVTVIVGVDVPCPAGQKLWDGGGTTNNWSDAGNWCDNSLPNAGSFVVFDAISIKDANVDVMVTVTSINIAATYTGTISVNDGISMTFTGAGNSSSLAGGTFTNGTGTITFSFTFLMSGGFFNTGSGTINFDRDLRQTGGLFNDPAGANTGNVNFGQFSDLVLDGGIFNAPQGNLTFNRSFTFTSGTFNHNNGSVVFVGTGGSFLGVQPSEIVFNNLTISKSNEGFVGIFPQTNRIARVTGTLTLSQGLLSGNTNSAFRAESAVNISSTFGAPNNPNNNGILLIENGPAGRSLSIPAGVVLPNLFVNDPGVTINAINSGLIQMRQLKMQRGVISFGSTNVTAGIGVATCIDQSGGSISIGSGNFLCQASVLLSQPDGANPSSFTAGTGDFTLDSPGRVFQISGGTFNAPAGTTTINTGEFNNDFTQTGGTFNGNGQFDCQCGQYVLSGGTFNAPSGTSTFRRVFKRTTGSFNPNGGMVVLTSAPGGGMVGPAITTFHHLTVAYTGNNHQLFATTTGTLILQSGLVDQGGSLNAQGDVLVESGFGGGNTSMTFSGSAIQNFTDNGGVLPTGIWTIDKSGGKVMLASDMNLSNGLGTFGLNNGIIQTNANLLDLGTRSVLGGGASSFVIGNLRRSYPGGGQDLTRQFALGATAGYAPVTVRVPITPGPTSGTLTPLTVSTVNTPHPLFNPAGSLSFYWKLTQGVGLQSTDVTFAYPQAAVNGNEADYRVNRIENGNIEIFNNTIFTSTNTVTLTGINNFAADWTMSELPPPLVLSCPSTSLNPGGVVQCTASGGRPPYQFGLAVNNSGASINPGSTSVTYTAGPTTGVTDTLRLTDSLTSTTDVMINVVDAFKVVNTNDSGAGSLRQAIINSNNTPGTQTITFAIPGPPPYSITAVSPRRFNINDPIVIDGTSQPGFAGIPIVEVKNAQFNLFASNSTIKGLAINGATQGIDARGIYVAGNTSGSIIQGNFIGTDITGNVAAGNGVGIEINGDANTIGGPAPDQRNVIAGNAKYGIHLFGISNAASDNVIKGNLIGTGADGVTPVGNGDSGIRIDGAQNNIIGGTGANEGNVIANNTIAGISTSNFSPAPTFGNAIRGNSMFANGGLGIDIRPNGISANDPCDADTGENRKQNFPDLTFVSSFGGNTNIQGTLTGEASKTFTLDFYSNVTADDSGFGEGQTYLGSGQVTTPAGCGGPTSFNVTLPVPLPSGQVVTATATDPEGDTSEFSAFLGVQPADIAGTILNSRGQPVKGVAVRLRRDGSTRILQTASTDRFGRFKFVNLPLGLNYEVQPVLNNFVFVPAVRTYPTFTTTQNDSYAAVVNNFSIGGHITMGAFSLSGATVTLSGAVNATTTTDSSGDYIFNNLPSGTYAVSVSKANVIFAPPTIDFPTPITSNKTANFDGVSVLSTLPGRIVFRDGEGNIKSMKPDSSGLVTLIPRNTAYTYALPRISRDGSKMVLNADCLSCPSSIPNEVRTSSIDGSVLSPSLAPGTSCFKSTFSPNASKIACQSSDTFGEPIITINSNGTGLPIALTSIGVNRDPDWSPDGTKIVYAKQISNGPAIIFRVNASGGGETPLAFLGTSDGSAAPRWSPDANRILFSKRFGNGGLSEIAVADAQGGNQVMIANSSSALTFPAWSPDASYVAFTKCGSGGCELRTTRVDVQDQLVIDSNFPSLRFDWGPDNNVTTPAGTNTQVDSGRVHITFPSTSSPGTTTITPIDPAAAGNVPGGFVVDGVAFEISTTATFTPPVEVCVTLTLIEPTVTQFNAYTFMHNENGVMVDRTSLRDFPTRRICGSLPSFSPVALMKQVDPALPTISGLVLDANGNPMNDVQVSISSEETPVKTDFDGHFEFVNLNPGADITIQAFKEGHLFAPPYQTFLNLSGDKTVVFTATAADFDISGTVVNEVQTPVAGVTIRLTGARESEVQTGTDGAFSFADLPANAEYNIRPISNSVGAFSPQEISVDALQSDLTGLVFTQSAPTAAGVTVSGRVTTAAGQGIGHARLTLTSRDGTTRTALTNPFGYFSFEDIEAGETYILDVTHKRYEFASSPRVLRVVDELSDVDFVASTPEGHR